MDGQHKLVTFESQVIIANNHKEHDLQMFVKGQEQDFYQVRSDQRATIKAG
jgi:hypothetical protein